MHARKLYMLRNRFFCFRLKRFWWTLGNFLAGSVWFGWIWRTRQCGSRRNQGWSAFISSLESTTNSCRVRQNKNDWNSSTWVFVFVRNYCVHKNQRERKEFLCLVQRWCLTLRVSQTLSQCCTSVRVRCCNTNTHAPFWICRNKTSREDTFPLRWTPLAQDQVFIHWPFVHT